MHTTLNHYYYICELSKMDNILFTLVAGLFIILFSKLGLFCYKYAKVCRLLRKLPVTTEPGHWLIGNLRKGQVKDSRTYVDLVLKETNEKNRKILLLWLGPFPTISITHPDTFKQLAKQVPLKARAPTDGYTFLESWLGEGLLVSGGKKWERNRKLLTPAFHFDILNGYVTVMNDVADNLLGFDPERFHANNRDETDSYGFIPFSAGSRNCIGQVFAMNEIKITIAKLVKRYEILLEPENEPVLLPDLIMRSENGIHVRLKKR